MVNVGAAVWMIAGCLLTAIAVIAIGGQALMPEVLLGMAAPLVSAVASWQVILRTHAAAPASLTSVLVIAFAAKAVLFGAYVALVLGVFHLRPVPFIAAFTSYYVALHLGEAVLLKRLLAAGGGTYDGPAGSPPRN
jgi:hypothetical protein